RLTLAAIVESAIVAETGELDPVLPFARLDADGALLPPGVLAPGQIHAASILIRPAASRMKDHSISSGLRGARNMPRGDEYEISKMKRRDFNSLTIPNPSNDPDYQNALSTFRFGDAFVGADAEANASLTHWFRFSGDGPEIRKIVASLPAIGKKRTAGFGWIAENGVTLHRAGEGTAGLPGVVGIDGLPERPVPYETWKKLVAAEKYGASAHVGREYVGTTMPVWKATPIDCAMPAGDSIFVGMKIAEGVGAFFTQKRPMLDALRVESELDLEFAD
ncbi:MAG: hypothetical protein ING19_21670, partial [Azospirillum sp.]|nr:hypothetical protein [Azospirillum sp.]